MVVKLELVKTTAVAGGSERTVNNVEDYYNKSKSNTPNSNPRSTGFNINIVPTKH